MTEDELTAMSHGVCLALAAGKPLQSVVTDARSVAAELGRRGLEIMLTEQRREDRRRRLDADRKRTKRGLAGGHEADNSRTNERNSAPMSASSRAGVGSEFEAPSGPPSVPSGPSQLPSDPDPQLKPDAIVRARRKASAKTGPDSEDRSAVWRMYASSYQRRYGKEPVRNPKVNGQLRHLCTRLPMADMAAVIDHYCRSQNARYVAAGHSVGCLLVDAEALHTEALTGRSRTVAAAVAADKTAHRGEKYEEVFERLRKFDAERAAKLGEGAT